MSRVSWQRTLDVATLRVLCLGETVLEDPQPFVVAYLATVQTAMSVAIIFA